ncbi:MAG: cyclohexanone monooxygenase, partial [Reyranella sp.]|nr:cyclohexanone monooxygenase [Reyranella sp.]
MTSDKNPDFDAIPDFDVIIVGAGMSGLFQLHRLRELGLKVRVFEAGTGVGGTWYWNRYPGARFDSESWSYGYSFSEELLNEWDWKEHFSPQSDNLEYLNLVADKFDLRGDIQFRSTVAAAHWNDEANQWTVTLESGETASARFLFTAIGILSAYTLPRIPGLESFRGAAYHTGRWPHTPVDFTGKRVGVIGTGATAIQAIPEIAKQAKQLTVFQRRPKWAAPLQNAKISKAEMDEIRSRYEEIYAHCATTPGWFIHQPDPRKTLEVPAEEREAFWEKRYAEPGFGIWMGNFSDIGIDEKANAAISEFIAKKIRSRVKDPKIAEKLIPKDHGFATRRVPLETGYFETYNRDNVLLVDVKETPIESITPGGIKTSEKEHEFDILVYATG